MQSRQKIIIGMSGGVDSSVAALLLLQQGYNVEGLFMKNWEEDDDEQYCAAAEDLRDASAVCETLGIRLHTVNFSSEYWDRVFQLFLDEYSAERAMREPEEFRRGEWIPTAAPAGVLSVALLPYAYARLDYEV